MTIASKGCSLCCGTDKKYIATPRDPILKRYKANNKTHKKILSVAKLGLNAVSLIAFAVLSVQELFTLFGSEFLSSLAPHFH